MLLAYIVLQCLLIKYVFFKLNHINKLFALGENQIKYAEYANKSIFMHMNFSISMWENTWIWIIYGIFYHMNESSGKLWCSEDISI